MKVNSKYLNSDKFNNKMQQFIFVYETVSEEIQNRNGYCVRSLVPTTKVIFLFLPYYRIYI